MRRRGFVRAVVFWPALFFGVPQALRRALAGGESGRIPCPNHCRRLPPFNAKSENSDRSVQRFFIQLSYDGSPYCGWQIQPQGRSVQGCLQEALQVLLKRPVPVVGCGRTDAGVNASCFYAHFDWDGHIPFSERQSWVYRLNALLDKQIVVHSVFEVDPDLHARFSATSRTYHYYLHTEKDPFSDRFSYFHRFGFDAGRIQESARKLCRYGDFTSFSKLHTQTKTNFCDLRQAEFKQIGPQHWVFIFTADRFLRNMVRAMVGTLLAIGGERHSEWDIESVLQAKDRCKAGISMPAHALFLKHVSYIRQERRVSGETEEDSGRDAVLSSALRAGTVSEF